MKIYTEKELNHISTTFARWLDEFDKRFLYATLKKDKRKADNKDYVDAQVSSYYEWLKKYGKDFQKVVKKCDSEKIIKATVEIRHLLTFVIAEFVENYFSNKQQHEYFVADFREKALKEQMEFSAQSDADAFAKYVVAKNYTEKFAHDLLDILGIRHYLGLRLRTIAEFDLFFIHILPIWIKAIFEGKVQYTDIKKSHE